MSGDGVDRSGEGRVHPTVRLLEAFYQAQADFSAGGDDTAALRRRWPRHRLACARA